MNISQTCAETATLHGDYIQNANAGAREVTAFLNGKQVSAIKRWCKYGVFLDSQNERDKLCELIAILGEAIDSDE